MSKLKSSTIPLMPGSRTALSAWPETRLRRTSQSRCSTSQFRPTSRARPSSPSALPSVLQPTPRSTLRRSTPSTCPSSPQMDSSSARLSQSMFSALEQLTPRHPTLISIYKLAIKLLRTRSMPTGGFDPRQSISFQSTNL